jgi:hypothetical protein
VGPFQGMNRQELPRQMDREGQSHTNRQMISNLGPRLVDVARSPLLPLIVSMLI